MSKDEKKPSSDIPESKPGPRAFPQAWQPLTPTGVAAFAGATIGRLLFVQLIVATLVAWCVLWFLTANFFPIVREAIAQLPDEGIIQNQQLSTPVASTVPLAENRFLSVVVPVEGIGISTTVVDLQVGFHRRNIALCSLFGCLIFDYPKDSTVQFNRPELQSRWGAWEPTILWSTGISVVVWLFLSWFVLATIYCSFVRVFAFFKDRQLTLLGSWKLCAAALLPAALMAGGSILLYGLGLITLLQFLLLWSLHLVVGWIYVVISSLRLPRASDIRPITGNPFGSGKPPAPPNPFSS